MRTLFWVAHGHFLILCSYGSKRAKQFSGVAYKDTSLVQEGFTLTSGLVRGPRQPSQRLPGLSSLYLGLRSGLGVTEIHTLGKSPADPIS